MLEVCVDSLESANNAINGGADEIEICSVLKAGGLTPSIGLVEAVLEVVKKLPAAKRPKLNAMIRIRDTFIFSDTDMDVMLSDLKTFKELGISGFVFGALTEASEVDESKCIQILKAAGPRRVTFHRAFDCTVEYKKSAAIIAALGFKRLLTSGHCANVSEIGAAKNIDYLIKNYTHGLHQMVIMPGGGISIENVETFIDIGCTIVHSSCKKLRNPMPEIEHGQLEPNVNNGIYITDTELVRGLKEAITNAMRLKQEEEQAA